MFGNKTEMQAAQGDRNLVVVIDPGHDTKHGGATYFGLYEHDIVYRIALYCKAELEKYQGVTVYLTRGEIGCPLPHTGNYADCNVWRAEYAASLGADLYISFHLNADKSGRARGAYIYYPNSNYRPDLGAQGKAAAASILTELLNIGIPQNGEGLLIRNSKDNTLYPDGSLADYLAVIRNAKLLGMPSALIEHVFLSNSQDVNDFLSTEEKIHAIGIADATGIAKYLNLTKAQLMLAEDGNWYYYVDGVVDTSYNGVAKLGETAWFVRDGKIDFSVNGIAYCGDACYYFQGGQLQYVDTLAMTEDGTWWCIRDGKVDFSYTGLAAYQGNWWYIENGQINWNYTGLVQHYDAWFYVENGMLNWNYTNLVQYNGAWFYVHQGQLHWGYTGLVQYNGAWFYVENGVLNWNYTGLVQHYDAWFYVENGVLNWEFTGLCQYNGIWFYIHGGQLHWGYTGNVYFNGTWWYVENGVMVRAA